MSIAYEVSTATKRFQRRWERWEKSGVSFPQVRHVGWWLLHNVVSHPALVYPCDATLWLHDWSSQQLNRRGKFRASKPPKIQRRAAWVVQNVAAHIVMGFLPVESAFRFHDVTAEWMDVPGWV